MSRVAGSQAPAHDGVPAGARPLEVAAAAAMTVEDVLALLGTTSAGLTAEEAALRRSRLGPNAVRTHHARLVPVLLRQLRSPLLVLLAVAAVASFFLGERTDAVIIAAILTASVGLGFVNEYRAEQAAEALHEQIRHRAVVIRHGHPRAVDVVDLVPGDVVELQLGEVVPADVRLLSATALQCDESVLTGESAPAEKRPNRCPPEPLSRSWAAVG